MSLNKKYRIRTKVYLLEYPAAPLEKLKDLYKGVTDKKLTLFYVY